MSGAPPLDLRGVLVTSKPCPQSAEDGIDFTGAQTCGAIHRLRTAAPSLDEQRASKRRAIKAAELDAMHDARVDLSAHVDLGKAVGPGRAVQRVNVDFPVDLLREIDQEARRLGVTGRHFITVGWPTRSSRVSEGLAL